MTIITDQEIDRLIQGNRYPKTLYGARNLARAIEKATVAAWLGLRIAELERSLALLASTPAPAQQPLTDEQCDAIYMALDSWAREFDAYEFGLPQVCGGGGEGGREVIRRALRSMSQ